jgi:hypothetical protein
MSSDEEVVMIPRGKLALLTRAAESAFRFEMLVRGYYEEHQSASCMCALCENAERALRHNQSGYDSAA